MTTTKSSLFPQWVHDFQATHGFMPIAGGSDSFIEGADPKGDDTQSVTAPGTDSDSGFPHYDPQAKNQNTTETRTFTAEDIEKARQQERDKIYKDLQKESEQRQSLEERLAQFEAERKAAQEEEEAKRQQEEEEAKRQQEEQERKSEEEMDVKELLKKKDEEWQQKFAELEAKRQQEQALLEKERQFNALQEHKSTRLMEEQDNIAPQFLDYIQGNSPEEIDQSIEQAKVKTQQILDQFQQAAQSQRQASRGVAPTSTPGPDADYSQNRTFSPAEIQNMSMAEYAQYRKQLQQAARQGGIYQ